MNQLILRASAAAIAVFVTWTVLDFILHGVFLTAIYAQTPALWRPAGEFKVGLNALVVLISAVCFVFIYAQCVTGKSMQAALIYGAVLGLAHGVGMGYGGYAAMPMPSELAMAWFVGSIIEYIAAGAVMGQIVKPQAAK